MEWRTIGAKKDVHKENCKTLRIGNGNHEIRRGLNTTGVTLQKRDLWNRRVCKVVKLKLGVEKKKC